MISVYMSLGSIVEGLFFVVVFVVVVTVYMSKKVNTKPCLEHILIRLLLINLQPIDNTCIVLYTCVYYQHVYMYL